MLLFRANRPSISKVFLKLSNVCVSLLIFSISTLIFNTVSQIIKGFFRVSEDENQRTLGTILFQLHLRRSSCQASASGRWRLPHGPENRSGLFAASSLSSSGEETGEEPDFGLCVWFGFSLIHSFGGLRGFLIPRRRGVSRSNQCVRGGIGRTMPSRDDPASSCLVTW